MSFAQTIFSNQLGPVSIFFEATETVNEDILKTENLGEKETSLDTSKISAEEINKCNANEFHVEKRSRELESIQQVEYRKRKKKV